MTLQSLKMAWSAIVTNKMRSFLTMLGIIIGVVSLVVLVSVVDGATSSVIDSIAGLGNDLLTVSISDQKGNPMGWEEVLALTEHEEFKMAAPITSATAVAKKGTASGSISLTGTTAGYFDIQGLELERGRFINNVDVENNTYVIVLNQDAAEELFGHTNVIGETISVNGVSMQVTGLLAEDENSGGGFNMTQMQAYIPYSTLVRITETEKAVSSFYITASDEESSDEAEDMITNLMLTRQKGDRDAFSVSNASSIMDIMSSVTSTLSYMLGGIAAISLVVGGIGIMNIMLVSVTERTREIGIRKAIGASYGNIMMQFLIEAVLISLIGCLIGIMLSWGIITVIGKIFTSYSFGLSTSVVALAVGFSAFVGIVFGSYPANKAAKKRPIDALRFS